jgi:hypothetical protein
MINDARAIGAQALNFRSDPFRRRAVPNRMAEPRTHTAGGSPESDTRMLSRSFTQTGFSQRTAAQRRLRRSAASRRLFCSTNGCTTFMLPDPSGSGATCPICGSTRRLALSVAQPAARPH